MISWFLRRGKKDESALASQAIVSADEVTRASVFGSVRQGLQRTASSLGRALKQAVIGKKIDDAALDAIEEALILTDMGVSVAARVRAALKRKEWSGEVSFEQVREVVVQHIAEILRPVAVPLMLEEMHHPFVVLVCGVNGSGKTTTIGKMAQLFKAQGHRVVLGAADTFRAAAVEQLKVWAERVSIPCVTGKENADPASVAFEAISVAKQEKADVVLIDTAGRLQNKNNLMEELAKIVRVIKKQDETAPHAVLLVLDATTGQNAHSQVRLFKDMVPVTGLLVTKLDGTAKGGVVVSLAEAFSLPVHAIGVGEAVEDLRPFDADVFAQSLLSSDSIL